MKKKLMKATEKIKLWMFVFLHSIMVICGCLKTINRENFRGGRKKKKDTWDTSRNKKPHPCKMLYFITVLPQKKRGRASERSAG